MSLPPTLPPLFADQAKFKQVMYNLLSNAIKFTPEKGKISVTARLVNTPEGQEEFQVSVADTGIGIKPEDHARVFQEFEQVDSSYARQQQGTGLGLTLTRKLVEAHGGRLWVESEGIEGKGSVFTFSIPFAQDQTGGQTLVAPPHSARPLVLVIEDDPHASSLIEQYLTSGGYQVATAYDGKRAVEMARELKPFAITLDIILPKKSGWEVLSELKLQPETKNIPVVVVSITEDRQLGFSLGAMEWIGKPVIKERLLDAIGLACGHRPSPPRSVLVVDDDPMTLELLNKVLLAEGYQPVLAGGGREGIQLATQNPPDLIILDLLMPDVNGYQVVEHLRSQEATRNVPIVIHTSTDIREADRKFLNVQAITSKSARDQLLQELERLAHPERSGGGPS